jgi:hypothetical protein
VSTDPVNVTGTHRGGGGPATSSQWWKAWILLTSLGATVIGWMALAGVTSPTDEVVVLPTVTATVAERVPLPNDAAGEPERLGSSVRSTPTLPEKPVFQAPVTRTRRS